MVKNRVAVLMGGVSTEREVSLCSGQAVASALEGLGHYVLPIVVNDEEVRELDVLEIEVAFIALHGYFGEDGGIQGILEAKGITYTGSGVLASRTAMDKVATKEVFLRAGLPTPEFKVLGRGGPIMEIRGLLDSMPLVVKPSKSGSSLGISIIKEVHELPQAMEVSSLYGDRIVLERYIQGRELTVGILGQEALPVIEIKPAREFYDYSAKYKDSQTQYIVDPVLPVGLSKEVQGLALKAHHALGCSDFSRVDMILSEGGKPYLLEVNTIPGFTQRSLLPKAAQAAGIGFGELCQQILELALKDSAPQETILGLVEHPAVQRV